MTSSYKDGRLPSGNPVQRLQCPMCGWIRPVEYGWSKRTGEKREVRFDRMDVENALIWRLEMLSGKGRASKEAKVELLEGRTLAELPDELKEQVRNQCHKILAILE